MSVRIILADDDENFRTTCEELLTDEGFDVTAVANGREAVEQFTALFDSGDPPAALVLDSGRAVGSRATRSNTTISLRV